MEIRVLEEAPTRRVLELTVPREEVERHLDRVAGQLQQRATLPGFRKGRVPRRLLEARFGSSLEQEALEGAVEEAYAKAVREQALEPVSMPAIDEVRFVPGEPLRFRATLEVRPTVELKDYKGMTLVRRIREVPEEEVERALAQVREEATQLVPVERPVGENDVVTVDHVRIDEKGRTLKASRVRDAALDLERPGLLPEFKQALLGSQAGESRTVQVQYPEDFGNAELAGKSARFHVKVKKIQEKKTRELDDNLARDIFGLETLDELRSRIRGQMEAEERLRSRRALEEEAVAELLKRNPVPVPEGFADRLAQESLSRASAGQEVAAEEREQLLESFRQAMRQRIAREWLLDAVAQKEAIDATEEELSEEMSQLARARGRAGADYRALPPAERRTRVRDAIVDKKVFDFLLDAAEIKEEKITDKSPLVVPA
jgi:trigger factor